jgi:hydrogenase/urease accessory protein HupE
MKRVLLALGLLLALMRGLTAHEPSIVHLRAEVVGRSITVTVGIKQALALAMLNDDRTLFATSDELAGALPQIGSRFSDDITLQADGQRLPLKFVGIADDNGIHASPPAGMIDRERLDLAFSAEVPANASNLTLSADMFRGTPLQSYLVPLLETRHHGKPFTTSLEPGRNVALNGPEAQASSASFLRLIGIGFTHIIPEGLDHILFVLGLFLLATTWRALLLQISAFTVAHSLTLGLAMTGVVSMRASLVEPLIALSIAVVAAEVVFNREPRAWRYLLVVGFGLVHGLGFASALSDFTGDGINLATTLAGFNIGVELGQLTVVATALLLTAAVRNCTWYHAAVRVPACCAIGLTGLTWTIQRLLAG